MEQRPVETEWPGLGRKGGAPWPWRRNRASLAGLEPFETVRSLSPKHGETVLPD